MGRVNIVSIWGEVNRREWSGRGAYCLFISPMDAGTKVDMAHLDLGPGNKVSALRFNGSFWLLDLSGVCCS